MKVRIYNPAKTAMQSGTKNTEFWVLCPIEDQKTRSISDLMGWTSSSNTNAQLKFKFKTKEDAISFAQSKDYEYIIENPKTSSTKKKSYANNFTKPVNP
jgi:hypothetical protein